MTYADEMLMQLLGFMGPFYKRPILEHKTLAALPLTVSLCDGMAENAVSMALFDLEARARRAAVVEDSREGFATLMKSVMASFALDWGVDLSKTRPVGSRGFEISGAYDEAREAIVTTVRVPKEMLG